VGSAFRQPPLAASPRLASSIDIELAGKAKMTTDREAFFDAYQEYSKVLRTWFVVYGIGGPVLLFTNDTFARTLKASGEGRSLAALFLAGVALQVVLAALNKFSMWGIYFGEFKGEFKRTRRYKLSHWFSEQFWIDFVVDILTLFLFAAATWCGYRIVVT
jgi:hypothetical protein